MTPYHRLLSLCITITHHTHTHTYTHTPTHPHTHIHTHSSSRCAEWELLCLASSLLGQSLVASANGNVATTRRALEAFLDSARCRYTCVACRQCIRLSTGDSKGYWHDLYLPFSFFISYLSYLSLSFYPTFSPPLSPPLLLLHPSPLSPASSPLILAHFWFAEVS